DMSDQCGARCPDCRRCLGLNFRVTLARTCTEESSQMTDQFQIKWTNGDSKDYVDILNTQLFAQETAGNEITHLIREPLGTTYLAKCDLQVKNNSATLTYSVDEDERWYPWQNQDRLHR